MRSVILYTLRSTLRPRRPSVAARLTRRLAVAVLAMAVSAFGVSAQDKRRIERVAPAATAPGAGGDRWALIVGVDQYQTKDIPPLSGAVADARAVRQALVTYADFPEKQVALLTESQVTVDDKKRRELYVKMQEMLADEAPAVWLYMHPRLVVTKKGVTGIWKDLPLPVLDLSEVAWQK